MFAVGRPQTLYQRRIFFSGIAKAFWNHRHCRWFSLYNKKIAGMLTHFGNFLCSFRKKGQFKTELSLWRTTLGCGFLAGSQCRCGSPVANLGSATFRRAGGRKGRSQQRSASGNDSRNRKISYILHLQIQIGISRPPPGSSARSDPWDRRTAAFLWQRKSPPFPLCAALRPD